jgi:hypothetical protein
MRLDHFLSLQLLTFEKAVDRLAGPHLNSKPFSIGKEPALQHNIYLDSVIDSSCHKYYQIGKCLIGAVKNGDYLVYAMCGRALIELVATLRYYSQNLAKLGMTSEISPGAALQLDQRQLQGSRFSWDKWIDERQLEAKRSKVAARITTALLADPDADTSELEAEADKLADTPSAENEDNNGPVAALNVLTAITAWSKSNPGVANTYTLFCDLVHPNMGSNLLIAQISDEQLYFADVGGEPYGVEVVRSSLTDLKELVVLPFAEALATASACRFDD